MIASPPVDPRKAADIVEQLRRVFRDDLPEWPRPRLAAWPAGDPGAALVEIFARLAEVTIERLNRAPEKHFLAFLEMLGVTLLPPAEARAPVQFFLADGAQTDALVRRETPLATTGEQPQNFETERDLWVSSARLVRTLTYDPRNDRYSERSSAITDAGLQPLTPFDAFVGSTLLDHILYLGHDTVVGGQRPTRGAIQLSLDDARSPDAVAGVLSSLSWFVMTAGAPRRLTPTTLVLGLPLSGTVAADGAILAGDGTRFTRDVNPGDLLMVPLRGLVKVDSVQSDTLLTLTAPAPPGFAPGQMFAFRVDAQSLTGSIHSGGSSTAQITGVGTRFSQELAVGDLLLIPASPGAHVVKTISSDTALELVAAVSLGGVEGTPAWRLRRRLSRSITAIVELADISNADSWVVAGVAARWLWAKTERPLLGTAAQFSTARAVALTAASTAPLLPDNMLANSTAVDLSKGGFPFGERPKLGDAFYLGSAEVFSKAGARVSLTADVQFPTNPTGTVPPVSLTWEFWGGESWEELGVATNTGTVVSGAHDFQDFTAAFTATSPEGIRFICPPCTPTAVGGKDGLWIRARISAGNYGEDAKLTTTATPPLTLADWTYTAATFRPPFLSRVTLSYEYERAENAQQIVVRNGFVSTRVELDGTTLEPRRPFAPFPPPEDTDATLALGWDPAFSNHPVSVYVAVAEQTEPAAGAQIRWQYWNGRAWSRLGLIRDETQALTEPGSVEFLGPTDFARSDQFGGDLHWVRAQLVNGDPQLFTASGLLPNVTWARHAVTVRDELIGSSNGKPRQVFTASRTPVLPGQRLEVRELEVPPADELAALIAEGESDPVRIVRDDAGRPRETWVRWHEVDHFQLSGPHSRHYVVDRARGRFIKGDGRRGRIPPPGRDNVRIAEYRAGGGQVGNVGAGAITVLKRSVPSIDRVDNPFAAGGGADLEDVESVKDRGPLLLRHRERAVSAEDYEALARQASRQVVRAKCLSAHDAATAGKVSILIVPSGGPRPLPTPGLLRRVKSYLDARRLPTADVTLFGPNYVDVSLTAQVVPVSFDDADLVRQRVTDALTAWLHPLTGGPDGKGWAFGRDVFLSEVAATIEAIDGIDHLAHVTMSGTAAGEDRTRDGGRRVEVREDAGELVASGTHTVTLAT